jgi:hypothetical protein
VPPNVFDEGYLPVPGSDLAALPPAMSHFHTVLTLNDFQTEGLFPIAVVGVNAGDASGVNL